MMKPRLGVAGAFGLPRREALPLVEAMRLEEAAQRGIRQRQAKLGLLLGKRQQIVVMELHAPALARCVLASSAWRTVAHRCLLAGIGAHLAGRSTPTGSCRSLRTR
jgi:hypothetical protein